MSYLTNRWVYIVFALALIGCAIFDYFFKKKWVRITLLSLLLAAFTVLAALRSNQVGLDTTNYSLIYENAKSVTNVSKYLNTYKPEYLFYSLVLLCSKTMNMPEVVFRVFYFLTISIFLFFSFWRTEKGLFKFAVYMMFGMLAFSFAAIRQAMAIAMMTFAFAVMLESKRQTWLKIVVYYVLNILAIGFHASSAILLIVAPLLFVKFSKNNFIFLFFLLIFAPFVIKQFIYFANYYINLSYEFATYSMPGTFILVLCLVGVYYLFLAFPKVSGFLQNKLKFIQFDWNSQSGKVMVLLFFFLAFMSCGTFSTIVTRIANFFFIGVAYFATYFVDCFSKKWMKITSYCLILLAFAAFFITSTGVTWISPYSFGL